MNSSPELNKNIILQYDTTFSPLNLEIISKIFSDGSISTGKYQKLLKEKLQKLTGCKYIFLTNSGTTGLHLALMSLGISTRDEVITPSYLCEQVLNSISFTGGKPIFVDINSDNYSINLEEIKKSINNKTKAIIVPYLYGDTFSISELKELNIPIIEDVCHCTGCSVNKKQVGSLGEIGITSFGEKKFLDGGFGGAVFTNNADLSKKIEVLLSHSNPRKYTKNYDYHIPNIIAAIIYEKSFSLKNEIKNRKKIAKYYINELKNPKISLRYANVLDSFFYRFMIDIPSTKTSFIKKMRSKGIVCGVGINHPLHELVGDYRKKLPNTEFAVNYSVALPIRPNLTENELNRIVIAVNESV